MTAEWPFNGYGVNNYGTPDALFSTAIALQNKFYFVTHTWDHPCTLDTASYHTTAVLSFHSLTCFRKAEMDVQLDNNINFTPSLLTGGLKSSVFSNDSIVNPCITGLFNKNVLQSMANHGIIYCVGDNSVARLVPPNPYNGIYTTVATHGYVYLHVTPIYTY